MLQNDTELQHKINSFLDRKTAKYPEIRDLAETSTYPHTKQHAPKPHLAF